MKFNKGSKKDEDEEENSKDDEGDSGSTVGLSSVPELRTIVLYGELEEKIATQIVYSLFAHKELKKLIPLDDNDPPTRFAEITEPVEFIISTPGGNAADMFSIYDTMNFVKNTMPIHTIGLGKVMSAGVLLLAAGTKGQRTVGKNCRLMIHSVVSGLGGPLHDMKNEMEETMFTQERYIEALAEQTKLSVAKIKKFLNEKRNVYLSAEEAKKLGIVDHIL